jgi:hypothetical protein
MAVAIQRIQVGAETIPVVITAAQAQDGTLTLRIEDAAGATDCPMTKPAMIALGNALIAVANS